VRRTEAGALASTSGRTHATPLRGGVLCGANEPSNFGSWMLRILPKLLLTATLAPRRPIIVPAWSGWMRSIVRLARPDTAVVEQMPFLSYDLEVVLVPSLPAPEAYLRPVLQGLLGRFAARMPRAPGTPGRIYLSRRKQAAKAPYTRVLENETALVEGLAALGFAEFVPEDHPLEVQVATLAQARAVICPGGSGLFTALFAERADMILDIEPSRTWSYAHRNILASSGRPWSMVQGVQDESAPAPQGAAHRNWRIDLEPLLRGLARLLR
jgi:capsular polysaccharide biosynthesis protein